MIVVSDTSPISNLAMIGQLELLQRLYAQIVIPEAVYQELLNAGQTDPAALAVQSVNWIDVRPVNDSPLLQQLKLRLDIGEAEAIALAVEIEAIRLIVDERRGRQIASQLGLAVVGLLGVLLAAKRQGLISHVKPHLEALIAKGFWLRQEMYLEVLRLANEI